jgi:hypothetical protein
MAQRPRIKHIAGLPATNPSEQAAKAATAYARSRLSKPKSKGSASIRLERQSKARPSEIIATEAENRMSQSETQILPVDFERGAAVLEGMVPQMSEPKVLENQHPHKPQPVKVMQPKPKAVDEKKAKKPPVNTRYAGSLAEMMDSALREGGTYAEIGKKLNKAPSMVKAHANFRVKGKYRLVDLGNDKFQLVPKHN